MPRSCTRPASFFLRRLFLAWNMKWRLIAMVLALAIPLNAAIFSIIWSLSNAALDAQRTSLRFTAQSIRAAVDAELGTYFGLGQGLARSSAALSDDLNDFDAVARKAFDGVPYTSVLLSDAEGRVLVTTQPQAVLPQPLPGPKSIEMQRKALESRAPVVSGVSHWAANGQWVAFIYFPVPGESPGSRFIVVGITVEPFRRLLNADDVPRGWRLGIMDTDGRFVARSLNHEGNVGSFPSEGWRATRGQAGIYEFDSLEGEELINANDVSTFSGWTIGVAITRSEVAAAAWSATAFAIVSGGSLSLLGMALAFGLAYQIQRAIEQTQRDAVLLLQNEATSGAVVEIPELRNLGSCIARLAAERAEVADKLARRHAELDMIYVSAPVGLVVVDLDLRVVRANDRFAQWTAMEVESLVGKAIREIVPHLADQLEPMAMQVLSSASAIYNQRLDGCTSRTPDVLCHWRVHWTPLRTDEGVMIGINAVFEDVTEQVRSDAAVREAAHNLQQVLNSTFACIGILDPDGTLRELNRAALVAGGVELAEVAGRKLWDCPWWSHDLAEMMRLEQAVACAADGESVRYDATIRIHGDGRSTVDFMLSPVRDLKGAVVMLVSFAVDITQRKQAENQARQGYATYLALIQNATFGVYLIDGDFKLRVISVGAQKVFAHVDPLIGRDFADVLRCIWEEPFASETIALFRNTLETGEPYHAPDTVQRRHDTGITEAYDWRIERVTLPDGTWGIVCYFYDFSERQRYEEQIRLIMRELNHRSKNLMTLVQAIARGTHATSVPDFVDRFSDRIQSLATNQDLLIGKQWRGVDLSELARVQLCAFADPASGRIQIDGPPIVVNPTAAQTLAMALHELATNAAKYGALTTAAGRVALEWSIGDGVLSMMWVESGGPPVTPPSRTGFGSQLFGRLVGISVSGTVDLDYAVSGVVWRLRCPVDRVTS